MYVFQQDYLTLLYKDKESLIWVFSGILGRTFFTERERERETERDRERQRETERETETDRQTDRQTERDRDRDRERSNSSEGNR